MSTRTLFSVTLMGVVAAACGGNVSLGSTGGNLSGGNGKADSGSGNTDGGTTVECTNPDACGPALGMPSWICPDGSTGGSTGRCIQKDGTCGWEVRDCPATDAGPAPTCFENDGSLKAKYKTCQTKADCVVATFMRDCCGTMLAAGVNKTSEAEVLACAQTRADGFPGCGCASQGTVADDGTSTINGGATASVDCKANKCETTFGIACGTTTCAPDQQCCEGVPFTTPTCVTGPSCPISQRQYKTDIRYLPEAEIKRLNEELMSFRLATYRYKTETPDAKSHLGFMIDDVAPSAAVHGDGQHVDLYGYATAIVA
jgi:hypothetical protein